MIACSLEWLPSRSKARALLDSGICANKDASGCYLAKRRQAIESGFQRTSTREEATSIFCFKPFRKVWGRSSPLATSLTLQRSLPRQGGIGDCWFKTACRMPAANDEDRGRTNCSDQTVAR